MQTDTNPAPASKAMLWAGWIISALVVAMFLMSGIMVLVKADTAVEGFAKFGYDPKIAFTLGIVEVACALVYAIPQTAVLGAILLTGYLGGATATHVRIGEPFIIPIILGMVVWFGLYLRDARVRALVPLRW